MVDFNSNAPLKCLLIAQVDWANVGYEYAKALRSVGADAIAIAQKPHSEFSFNPHAHIYRDFNEINFLAKKADIIILMHSINTDTGVEHLYNKPDGKGVCVFHGGSLYRNSFKSVNDKFLNKLNVKLALIQTVDLLGKDDRIIEEWLLPPVNTDDFQPVYTHKFQNKKILAHYPSTPGHRKGTENIRLVIEKLKQKVNVPFEYLTGPVVPYTQNLERVKGCDIYIECLSPTIGGLLHGEWGMSALEAAAFGKVLVTNFLSSDKYIKEYGPHSIVVANTEEELFDQLKRLLLLSMEELTELQKNTRAWVERYHSYQAVGKRMLKIFDKHLVWQGKEKIKQLLED